jgi:hypothetical protein
MRRWHEKFPGKILDVCYEDLVRQPGAACDRVYAFCGLVEFNVAEPGRNYGAITTASSAQVRGEITSKGIGAWERYTKYLQPLQSRLQKAGVGVC